MTLDARNYPEGTPVYTFVDDDGTTIHVDSELLRQWCAAHKAELEEILTPIDSRIARNFLKDNVVDLEHVKRVMHMPKLDPIIYGMTGTSTEGRPDVLLIDGHHRFFRAWILNHQFIPSYILRPDQWQAFQIIGLPSLTQDQLRSKPTKLRGPK